MIDPHGDPLATFRGILAAIPSALLLWAALALLFVF